MNLCLSPCYPIDAAKSLDVHFRYIIKCRENWGFPIILIQTSGPLYILFLVSVPDIQSLESMNTCLVLKSHSCDVLIDTSGRICCMLELFHEWAVGGIVISQECCLEAYKRKAPSNVCKISSRSFPSSKN